MTQEALKLALEALENGDVPTSENAGKNLDAITAIKEALAQTQEPFEDLATELFVVAQTSPADDGFSDTIERIESWLREHFSTPPQRTERPVDCERCNRLEEHAYDLIAKLRVANIKLSMQSKACVYCGQLVMEEKNT